MFCLTNNVPTDSSTYIRHYTGNQNETCRSRLYRFVPVIPVILNANFLYRWVELLYSLRPNQPSGPPSRSSDTQLLIIFYGDLSL